MISEGTNNSINITIRKVVEAALAANATSVVLAHNHPGGYALPSKADEETTIRLNNALKDVDVTLIDHVIFSDTDHTCFFVSSHGY